MIALCALLAAAAAWLAVRAPTQARLAHVLPDRAELAGAPGPQGRVRGGAARGASGGAGIAAGLVAGVGAWVLLGGVPGVVLGAACAAGLPRLLGRLESRGERDRREELERQAPLLADLLSATLASGATLRNSLDAASCAVGEPTAGTLRPVITAIDLGADPAEAWQAAGPRAEHRPIVDTVVGAAESGTPLSAQLARIAGDLRRERMTAVQVAARSAGVRAVAPLAACFLPAFVLVGVIPVVASLATGLIAP